MSNHTPGPWVIKDDGSYEDAILIAAERKGWSKASQPAKIAMVGDNVWWDDECVEEEDRANARLIAAAPQLLEALEEAEKDLVACRINIRRDLALRGNTMWEGVPEILDARIKHIRAAIAAARGEGK